MSSNQRKEIIKQIQDLAHSRKSVHIADMKSNGINFIGGELDNPDGGVDGESLIVWDKVFYLQDIGDSIPTDDMFANIDNLISPNIGDTDVVCLSGLNDTAIDYHKCLKYTTLITPNQDGEDFITVFGQCKATVYIDDILVHTHVYDPNFAYSRTQLKTSVARFQEYKVEVFVYGHLPNVHGDVIRVVSDIFTNIRSSRIPIISPPRNVFATANLPDTIRVSWDQNPSAPLTGGGTEIYARVDALDSTFVLLDRVSYPNSFYIHSSQLEPANILPNGAFQDIVYEDSSEGDIPEGSPGDPYGILDWGVEKVDCELFAVPTNLSDYTTAVRMRTQTITDVQLSRQISVNLPDNDDAYKLNTGDHVPMDYNSTYYLKTGPNDIPDIAAHGGLLFKWTTNDILTDADVRCTIYKNGSPTTVVVPATDGTYTFPLVFGDINAWQSDLDHINAEFRVTPSDSNSDPASSEILLDEIRAYIVPLGSNKVVRFSSPRVSVGENEEYALECLYSFGRASPSITNLFYCYDIHGNSVGTYSVREAPEPITYSGDWATFKNYFNTESFPSGTRFITLMLGFVLTDTDMGSTAIDIQRLSLLKGATKTLPPQDAYIYKLRNYTREFSLSFFTPTVTGHTSEEMHYMYLESDDNYVSQFFKSKIYARATTPLSSVDVEAQSATGQYTVPLQQVGASSNGADFTFEYKPLFSVPVIYDTFNYDRAILNPSDPPNTNNIVDGFSSAEEAPARLVGKWNIANYFTMRASYAPDDGPPYGLWPDNFPDSEDFRTIIRYTSRLPGNYKEYDIGQLPAFYRNIFGSTDDPDAKFHQHAPENATKFSVGMIFRPNSEPYSFTRMFMCDSLFVVGIYTNPTSHLASMLIYVKGWGHSDSGNPEEGDILFRHDFPYDENDWYYVHASADVNAQDDPNRTYITMHNVSTYPDTTMPNYFTDGVSNFQDGKIIFRYEPYQWNWRNADYVKFGTASGGSGQFSVDVDQIYLTADIIEKSVIDDVCTQIIAESKNPHFSTYGYKSGFPITYFAEGITGSGADVDQADGAIPYDADVLTAETSQIVDWNEPDGTVYILREAFTLNQHIIDNLSEVQPQVTYSIWNKIYSDFTSPYSDTYKIRFSNDRTTWGKWTRHINEILYPWKLKPLGEPQDTSEGGYREIFAQTITEAGNTSDVWLKANHRDTILYNPIGSIGSIESFNYLKGSSGWALNLNGDAEFNDLFLRNGVINMGKAVTALKLTEANVRSQLAAEYTVPKVRDNYFIQPAAGVPYTAAGHSNYNSDIVGDLYNNDILYVPIRRADSLMVSRYTFVEDQQEPITDTVVIGTADNAKDPYAMPHVALTEYYVYTAGAGVIKKYDKTDFIEGHELASTSMVRANQRVCCAYTTNGDLRIYCPQIGIQDNWMSVLIFDEDLNEIQRPQFLSTGFAAFGDFKGHVFDCDGVSMVWTHDGNIYRASLDQDGLAQDLDLNRAHVESPATYLNDTYGTWGSQELCAGGAITEITYPTGVNLMGNRVFLYNSPGNFPHGTGTPNPHPSIGEYTIFTTLNVYESAGAHQAALMPTSVLFLANNIFPMNQNSSRKHGYFLRNLGEDHIFEVVEQLLDASTGAPFRRREGIETRNDTALGFVPPIVVKGSIYTSYTASVTEWPAYEGNTMYDFGFNGRYLGRPTIFGSDPYRRACSMFYNGHVLSVLCCRGQNAGNLSIDRYIV